MSGSDLVLRINSDNSEPRVACTLVLDTSYSMTQPPSKPRPIDELNAGLQLFAKDASNDSLTAKSAEVSIITYGGAARVQVPFCEVRDLEIPRLVAAGRTPMGEAVSLAAAQTEFRKRQYREHGIEYYRPWVIVMSDGKPTDGDEFFRAVRELNDLERRNALTVFPIAVGSNADLSALSLLSVNRRPLVLHNLSSFQEFFLWLSNSLSAVSSSNSQVGSDRELEGQTGQVPLPPADGWGHA